MRALVGHRSRALLMPSGVRLDASNSFGARLLHCGRYSQWVIEDDFALGRPAWEHLGALFVPDVHPYEMMKLRLLNGGHSAIACGAYLMGHR